MSQSDLYRERGYFVRLRDMLYGEKITGRISVTEMDEWLTKKIEEISKKLPPPQGYD